METGCSSPQMTALGTCNVTDYILLSIQKFKNRIAQVDSGTKEQITFSDIVSNVITFEKLLTSCGIKKGDVVMIASKNTTDFCWIVLGSLAVGAICSFLNPYSTARELQHFLSIVKPEIVIAPYLATDNIDVLSKENSVRRVYTDSENTQSPKISSYQKLLKDVFSKNRGTTKHRTLFSPTLNDPALLLTSSGTTGLPKAVVLKHVNVIAALENSGLFMRFDGVALGLMPFSHAYGLGLMLMALCEGSKMVIVNKFDLKKFQSIIVDNKVTHLYLVPSLLITLGKSDMITEAGLLSVKEVMTGAGPITLDQQHLLRRKLKSSAKLFHSYGMTETTFVVLFGEMRPKCDEKPQPIGRLVPGFKAKVVDEEGNPVAHGVVGELLLRGPSIFHEYLHNAAATEEAIDKMGWLHTGDLVKRDSEGYYAHIDRKKLMIKYQGYQVSPTEVEMVLLQHDAVMDATVVGVEHEVFGEIPTAIVVKKKESETTEDELIKLVRTELSSYKQIRGGVLFVNEIPRSESGKVNRNTLKSMYWAKLSLL